MVRATFPFTRRSGEKIVFSPNVWIRTLFGMHVVWKRIKKWKIILSLDCRHKCRQEKESEKFDPPAEGEDQTIHTSPPQITKLPPTILLGTTTPLPVRRCNCAHHIMLSGMYIPDSARDKMWGFKQHYQFNDTKRKQEPLAVWTTGDTNSAAVKWKETYLIIARTH